MLYLPQALLIMSYPQALLIMSYPPGLVNHVVPPGLVSSILTIVAQVIQPVHYRSSPSGQWVKDEATASSWAGMYGGILISSGVIATAVVSPILLDKYRLYKPVIKVAQLCTVLSFIFLMEMLRPSSPYPWLTAVAFALLGVFTMPLLPACLEAGAESTFPIGEEYSTGCLMLAGQLFGVIITIALPHLINLEPNWHLRPMQFTPCAIFTVSVSSVGALCCLAFNGDCKKQKEEAATAK